MTLKEAIEIAKLWKEDFHLMSKHTETLTALIETAEAVEKWRGKLPKVQGKADEHIPDDKEDAYRLGYQDAIDDCASAYVANMPTQEDVLKILLDLSEGESAVIAKKIHGLFVGKVRK